MIEAVTPEMASVELGNLDVVDFVRGVVAGDGIPIVELVLEIVADENT
jgi:hypothetical protein